MNGTLQAHGTPEVLTPPNPVVHERLRVLKATMRPGEIVNILSQLPEGG